MKSSNHFAKEELKEIIDHSFKLMSCGYFSGLNLLKSKRRLPVQSIIVHFLHDDKKHIDFVRKNLDGKVII